MASPQVVPPLPQGYSLDQSGTTPPLPAGYKLDAVEAPKQGFMGAFADDMAAMVKGAPEGIARMVPGPQQYFQVKDAIADYQSIKETGKTLAQRRDDQRKAAGYSLPYRVIAPVGEAVGVNATGMEEAAAKGDSGAILGHATAAAAPYVLAPVAGEAVEGAAAGVRKFANPAAERLYQSALKPPPSLPATDVKALVRAGLNESIPVSEAGVATISKLVDNLNNEVKSKIASGAQAGQTVDPSAVAQRVDQVRGKFSKQVNPNADLAALDASKQEFLQNNSTPPASGIGPANVKPIPVDEAQAIKQGTYRQMSAKAYGEMGTATTEAQKALARGIKEELEVQFPEIKGVNARIGSMLDLDEVLQRAVNREANKVVLPLGGPIAGGAVAAATGSGPAGAAAFALKSALENQGVKSRLAISISKGSGMTIDAANARVASYLAGLGAANASDHDGQGSGKTQ